MKNGWDCTHFTTQHPKDFSDPEPRPADIYSGIWNPRLVLFPNSFKDSGVYHHIRDRDRERISELCPSCEANAYLAIGESNVKRVDEANRDHRLAMAAHKHYCTRTYQTRFGAYLCNCKEYNGPWAPGGSQNLHF